MTGSVTVKESIDRCLGLARSHYENFPVARLVPKRLRPAVAAVYAFARTADDHADEGYESGHGPTVCERLGALDSMEGDLDAILRGLPPRGPDGWLFPALAEAMERHSLPEGLFRDLLSAFRQDVVQRRYQHWEELIDYSRRSANPIGRLVLLLHGERSPDLEPLSDSLCTALQLANFWQDLSLDRVKDRVYLPGSDLARYGQSADGIVSGRSDPAAVARCVLDLSSRTRALFLQARTLPSCLPRPLRWEIRLTWWGGWTILDRVDALRGQTLMTRPTLRTADRFRLLALALFGR